MRFYYYAETNNQKQNYHGKINARNKKEAKRKAMKLLQPWYGADTFISLNLSRQPYQEIQA